MSAIVDTSAIIALHNSDEPNNLRAREIFASASKGEFGRLLLPEYVFDEVVTLSYSRKDKKTAMALGEWLLSTEFEFIYSDQTNFSESWELFKKTSQLSFTDCVIASLARKTGAQIITFDKHFKSLTGLRVIS